MKYIHALQRARYVVAIIALLLVTAAGLAVWAPRAYQQEGPRNLDAMKRNFHAQIGRGVGSEGKFAHAKASPAQVHNSVGSVADFIQRRSSLTMSDQTRERVEALELASLRSGNRISTTALSAALADTITERIATLSDRDIDAAAEHLNPSGREVSLRANGNYRVAREEFAPEAKKFRDQLNSGDTAAADAVRATVGDEVENSVALLNEADPDQFGGTQENGLTPTQALVVTYSVLADDNLAESSADVQQKVLQAPKKPGKRGQPAAYGPNGSLFSSPTQLFFNRATMGRFLDRLEKGGGAQ